MLTDAPEVTPACQFTLVPDASRVAILDSFGRYLTAVKDAGHKGDVYEMPEMGNWEIFTLEPQANGKVAFRTYHGTYLRAAPQEGDQDKAVRSIQLRIEDWEKFTIEFLPTALRTAHGTFLCASKGEDGSVHTTADRVGTAQLFNLEPGKDGEGIAIRSVATNCLLTAERGELAGRGSVMTDRQAVGNWETLHPELHCGKVAFRTYHGTYLTVGEGMLSSGTAVRTCVAGGPDAWEVFRPERV